MDPHSMQWILCSVAQLISTECSGFHASWRNWSQLNAVKSIQRDWMQCIPCSLVKCNRIECSGFHAAWLNAVDSMQPGKIHPDWMQWILCSMIECSGFLQHEWMQWIFCSMAQSIPIECSGFRAACPKTSRLNAVDTMQHDWMQWMLCSMAQMHPDRMQRIPCSVIECRIFHTYWCNGFRLYAVESMQRGPMHPDWMQWILCSMA